MLGSSDLRAESVNLLQRSEIRPTFLITSVTYVPWWWLMIWDIHRLPAGEYRFHCCHDLLLLLPVITLSFEHGCDSLLLCLCLSHFSGTIGGRCGFALHCWSGLWYFCSVCVLRRYRHLAGDITCCFAVSGPRSRQSSSNYGRRPGNNGGIIVILCQVLVGMRGRPVKRRSVQGGRKTDLRWCLQHI